jgi:N-ethylmaleimide reductase
MGRPPVTAFTPVQIGPYRLTNRLVMAPMTRNRAGPGNVPQALNVEYYAQRAGAGLIITEGSQVSPQGVGYPATPGIHSRAQILGWRQIADAVHARHGRIFLQLWHVGRISHPSLQTDGALPVAPSAIKPAGQAFTYQGLQDFVTPRALTTGEIPDIVEQFRGGAANALEAGFDGVEIHAANGYIIDQFLRDGSNQRGDAYGGSLENRTRLLLEIVAAVCDVWTRNCVGVRLSPLNPFNDMCDANPEALFSHAVEALNQFDLAYLHINEQGLETPGAAGPVFDLRTLRRLFNGPHICNAGYDLARANAALAAGDTDLVAFARLFLANPDLPARFARNAPLNVPDEATFYGGTAKGYTDYPALSA